MKSKGDQRLSHGARQHPENKQKTKKQLERRERTTKDVEGIYKCIFQT